MCGIVGFISKEKDINTLNLMLNIQSHRGPDDRGVFFDSTTGVHLGHNRLSILDLSSAGHQPMVSSCGNYVIVYNGEVYNFKEIKKDLEKKGYKFNSNTDTEVILYSYIEWGIEAVNKFIGMFAIGILDKKRDKLILIRDRTGVKPLYFYKKNNFFAFASELKSLYVHPKFEKNINLMIIPYYFQFGYIPSPHTIFEDTYKLEPGSFLEYDLKNNEYVIKKYWNLENFYLKDKLSWSENEILEKLESLLEDAINLRMIADVPIGVFLSGGIDSSLVSAILSKKQKIKTFTIGFKNKDYDESKYAKKIAEYLGTDHTEYIMEEKDLLNFIENLTFYYDEPFGDSSALPTMLVSKLSREKVKVVLSADGGDEIFCGYSKYFFLYKLHKVFSNKILRNFTKLIFNFLNEDIIYNINNSLPEKYRQRNIKEKFLKFKRALYSDSREEIFINASSYLSKEDLKSLLNLNVDKTIYKKFHSNVKDILDYMMLTDYRTFLVDDVLVKVDRATMSVSLEGREPLLDHRIAEFLARVPSSLKYKNGESKYLAKKILYKYLPSQLLDRPKSGFQIPLDNWLRKELKEEVDFYLSEERLDDKIFNTKNIIKLKETFFRGKPIGSIIWFILVFQMWRERWFEKDSFKC